jgi:HD-like signal output (HDOD) protein/DNA-binding response OmpR family regulator
MWSIGMSNVPTVLIVDDEVAMQRLSSHALRQHGFRCDVASSVIQAQELLGRTHYDVVITELRLPRKNAYSTVLELLQAPKRPIVIVCTNVIDARLTKDLLIRGVDDIFAKPLNGAFFAGKIRALLDIRAAREHVELDESEEPLLPIEAMPADEAELPIGLGQLYRKLDALESLLPVSDAALDVAEMTRQPDWHISQIAAAIQRDPALTANVLKLANCSLYNPNPRPIIDLEQAVARIGGKRVGDLALATSALVAAAQQQLPWLDLNLAWKRSMAAGLVMEALIDAGGHQGIEEGLLVSAIMYPVGRVALGMLFPSAYEQMIAICNESGEPLQEQERRNLPTTHVQVLAHILAQWRIGPTVFQPLRFALDEYSAIARLTEPIRTRAELIKLAILLGRFVVGEWQDWDLVQLPSPAVMKRLKIADPIGIISRARQNLERLAAFSIHHEKPPVLKQLVDCQLRTAYCKLSPAKCDFVLQLLPCLGIKTQRCDLKDVERCESTAVINCIGAPHRRLRSLKPGARCLVLTDSTRWERIAQSTPAFALPNSFGRLRRAFLHASGQMIAGSANDAGAWIKRIAARVPR